MTPPGTMVEPAASPKEKKLLESLNSKKKVGNTDFIRWYQADNHQVFVEPTTTTEVPAVLQGYAAEVRNNVRVSCIHWT